MGKLFTRQYKNKSSIIKIRVMKMKNNIKGKIIGIIVLIVVTIALLLIYFLVRSPIEFNEKIVKIEINSAYDARKNIKKVRNGSLKSVQINDKEVNYQKLGQYSVIYTYKKKEYKTYVKVVDSHAPQFDVKNLDIDLGMHVQAQDMVENIKDATHTQVYFKKKYSFDQEGTQEVTVCVKDEGKNITEKKAKVTIVKDSEAPDITGLDTLTIVAGGNADYQKGVEIKDNRDPSPQLQIDFSQVDLTQVGTYYVTYTGIDRSGNKISKQREIQVVNRTTAGINKQSNEKIVYLTFDDGPSQNTKSILDILDRYHAKATFFVTGNNQTYNYLIKLAHEKGHTIALHTYCHDYKKVYASSQSYFDDLTKVGNMVKGLIGYVPRYVRFPGGSSNTISRRYCTGLMSSLSKELINRGYQYYDWNVSSSDASGNNVAVNTIINQATSSHVNNINILFHDSSPKTTTVQALPTIIEHYQALGYRFEAINDQSFIPHQRINN